jgi:DNA-directed RNA polymerase specialized sigma24 family protein
MSEGLMFLLSGLMFLFVIFWQTRKDRLYLFELEKRLEEKEKRLYELYHVVEDIIRNAFPEAENVLLHNGVTNHEAQLQNSGESLRQNIDGGYNEKRKAVILMHKSGSTEEEIARKLGIGKGEVKLILGLKDN